MGSNKAPFFFRVDFIPFNGKEVILMTWKQIEASREIRLWVGQILIPAATLAATTLTIPEVREAVAAKAKSVKMSIESKMKKRT